MFVRSPQSESRASPPPVPAAHAPPASDASPPPPAPAPGGPAGSTGDPGRACSHPPAQAGPGRSPTALRLLLAVALALVGFAWWAQPESRTAPAPGPASLNSLSPQLRADVERLDALLLRSQLTDDPEVRGAFRALAREWTVRLSDSRAAPDLAPEHRELLGAAAAALHAYLGLAEEALARGRIALRRDTAEQLATAIAAASAPLRDTSRRLAETQASRPPAASPAKSGPASHPSFTRVSLAMAILVLAAALVLPCARTSGAAPDPAAQSQGPGDPWAQPALAAAGVAHEIRNPLTAIRSRLHPLRQCVPASGQADLQVIDAEIRRLDRIVEDFLEYARPTPPRREQVEVADLLRGLHELLERPYAERGVAVRLEVPDSLLLEADPAQLRQVILNLARNAAESLATGGTMTLRARAGMDTRSRPARPVVMIEVADTGPGIAPEVEARLFQPFVTGKPRGTGLGLSIAARLAEAHGGHLQYQTQPGRGTVFTVVLPRAIPTPGPTPEARA